MDSVEAEIMDISKLKVPELKKELKNRGLATVGNKVELIDRLATAMKNKDDTASAESVEDLDEDLLNDDDDEHIDEISEVLNDLDSPVETMPVPKLIKRKSSDAAAPEPPKQPKKIILHRNITMSDEENGKDDEIKKDKVAETTDASDKKVIKFSELSAKERLELRAKKFGQPLSGDAKKQVRAERFSGNNTITASGGSVSISASAPASVDVLKQRAQRFGVSVSATLTKMENQEKLEKRKERFGGATNGSSTTTTTTPTPPTSASTTTITTDKAAQRLERFKLPIK